MRTWHLVIWGVLSVAVAGCGDPPPLIQVNPPGDHPEYIRPEESPDTAPQALGEQIGQKMDPAKAKARSKVKEVPPAGPTARGETKTTAHGVTYETLKAGGGPAVKPGQTVVVHYVGTLDDGTKFDSSRDRDQAAEFSIGTGDVIAGWDEAVVGMKVGEVRTMTIPSALGYKETGNLPSVPPNATLHFEIEVLTIK